MTPNSYQKAIALLHAVATPHGFLASSENTGNYQRVWARDGVICGLAALASDDAVLIATFRNTLETLAQHQHPMGTIPSNVALSETQREVSYGGLAGRVDAVTWFIIGICQYALHQNDRNFWEQYRPHVEKGLTLLKAWEYNNKHLVYVPLSGNWADEYLTDGYVLYDQLLRIWALRLFLHWENDAAMAAQLEAITTQVILNFFPNSRGERFHERAYQEVVWKGHVPCSFSPSGYKPQYDALAHALLVLLDLGTKAQQQEWLQTGLSFAANLPMGLIPAFWPPVTPEDTYWHLLHNNCKYEFRNHPYEFHNGGSWAMVNGFFGWALHEVGAKAEAQQLLEQIHAANAVEDFSFYENFNSKTAHPNGVAYCAWSAAGAILLQQVITNQFKLVLK